jgi:hypothetical protein
VLQLTIEGLAPGSNPAIQIATPGVDSSVQKTAITAKIPTKFTAVKKCLILAFFCQHYGRKFCRNFV